MRHARGEHYIGEGDDDSHLSSLLLTIKVLRRLKELRCSRIYVYAQHRELLRAGPVVRRLERLHAAAASGALEEEARARARTHILNEHGEYYIIMLIDFFNALLRSRVHSKFSDKKINDSGRIHGGALTLISLAQLDHIGG